MTAQGLGEESAANEAGNPVLYAVVVFLLALPGGQSHLRFSDLYLFPAALANTRMAFIASSQGLNWQMSPWNEPCPLDTQRW